MKKNKSKSVASLFLAATIALSSTSPACAAVTSFKPSDTAADSFSSISLFHSHDFGQTSGSDKNFGDVSNPYHTSSYVPLWSYKDGSAIANKDTSSSQNSPTDKTSVNPFVLRAFDTNKNETVAYSLGDRFTQKDGKLTGSFTTLPSGSVSKSTKDTPITIKRILQKGYPNVSATDFNKNNSTTDLTDQDLEWATQMAISLVLSNPDIAQKDAAKNVQDFFDKSFKTVSSDTTHATEVEKAVQIMVKASNDSSIILTNVTTSGPAKAKIIKSNGTIIQGPYKFSSSAPYDISVSATITDSEGKETSLPASLTSENNGGGTAYDSSSPVSGDKSYYLYVKDVPKDSQNVDVEIEAKADNSKAVQVDTFQGSSPDTAAMVIPASYTPYSSLKIKASTEEVNTAPVSIQLKDSEGNSLANTDAAEIGIYKSSDNSLVDSKTVSTNPLVFNLTEGSYYSKESKAPTGYKLNTDSNDKHSFSVVKDTDGNVSLKDSQNLTFVQEPTSVTLTHVDASTTKGIAGSTISVYAKDDQNTPVVAPEVTDDNGEVVFKGLPAGDYVYKETASSDGKTQNNNTYNFTINPDGTLSSTGTYVFSDKIATFGVKVVDSVSTNKGLSGAEISIYPKDNLKTPLLSMTSDKDGSINFLNFPFVGDFSLIQTKAPTGYTKDSSSINIRVTENGDVKDASSGTEIVPSNPLVFKNKGTALTLNVNDETNAGMDSVSFNLTDTNNANNVFSSTSDKNGILSFVGVTKGTYTLTQTSIPAGYYKIADSTISIDANGKLNDNVSNKIQLKPTSVTITKTDFDKKTAIVGTEITVSSESDKKTYSAKTDDKGSVSFSKLPVGKYTYTETAPTGGYQAMTDKIPFEIKEDGSVIGNLTITNKKTSVCIKCVDPTGNPISKAVISLKDSQGQSVNQISGTSGTDGIVNITYLPSGEYYISEDSAPAGFVKPSSPTHFSINKNGVTVYDSISTDSGSSSAKYPNTAAYVINSIASLSIKVTDGLDNSPVVGAEYELTNSSNNTVSVKSDKKGMLSLSGKDAAVGTYSLVEKKAPDGYVTDSKTKNLIIMDTGYSVDGENNAVIKNQKTEVTITLTDKETGSALAGGKFKVKDSNNKVVFEGETTKEGSMTIYGLPVGSYTFCQTAAPTGYKSTTAQFGFKIDKNGAVSGDTAIINSVSDDSLGLVENPSSGDGTPTDVTAGTDTKPVDDGSSTSGKTDGPVKTGIETDDTVSTSRKIILASVATLGIIGASLFGIKRSIRRKKDNIV